MLAFVGTSGWQYKDWRGRFYPRGVESELAFFSERFATVEVNNSFYRLPSNETVDAWRTGSAERFLITLKASRYITHIRRLKDCAEPIQFLALLPASMPSAFEFRHRSWFTDETYEALREAGAALVLADKPGARVDFVVTAPWSYVRFHAGTSSGSKYTRAKLRRWADRIATLDVPTVYVYFNNDQQGAAIEDAVVFRELLEERGVEAPVSADLSRGLPVLSR